MRPLKPYLVALGGFIAAVLGAIFVGFPPVTTAAPARGPGPDLQSKRMAPAGEFAASKEAKAASKAPTVDPDSPAGGSWAGTSSRTQEFASISLSAAPERIIDWRQRLLVGIIELRI